MAGDIGTQLRARVDCADSEKLWLVAVASPVHFAAAVVGCWMAGVTPVLSADLQMDTLRDLSMRLDGILCDDALGDSGVPTINVVQMAFAANASDDAIQQIANPEFSAEQTALVLFTSGSTGKKKRITKPFLSIFEEIKNLENVFGREVNGLPRRSTVSHFHIYGFLFNIMWPLHCGHTLSTPWTFYWEQILSDLVGKACIVSSPAHLRVLSNLACQYPFHWRDSVIFSSGGPLDRSVALEIFATTGIVPAEIFGSTETGGVAVRRQSPDAPTPFTPFCGVQVRRNDMEGLEVRSPWIDTGEGWVETGDRIEMDEFGAFYLRGRYDMMVKIAGKRVSLTEMENALREMPEILDVRVFQYCNRATESREVLAAVIVPRQTPVPTAGAAKRQTVQLLKDKLKRRFDLVAMPRYWRFVKTLPVDAQGKVTIGLLEEVVQNGG